jgi:hypothetical protein
MNNMLEFLKLLNKVITPAKSEHPLIRAHSVELVLESDGFVEVNLFPLAGGQYYFPINIIDKSIEDVVLEVKEKYEKCLIIQSIA